MTHETVVILDFGSQYTQLIARRVRELRVFSEVLPFDTPLADVLARRPKGLILSGGPESVYQAGAPLVGREMFEAGIPVLGICYGMQLMTLRLGGKVEGKREGREFGPAVVTIDRPEESVLFRGLSARERVWASHGDHVPDPAPGFVTTATSQGAPHAAVEDRERSLFGLLFHPEVVHTEHGREILGRFLFEVCGCRGDWSIRSFVEETVREVRETVGDRHVICALSGGVDSSVMALLLQRALGERLTCIFVDNGLLREGEVEQVLSTFRERYHLDVRHASVAVAVPVPPGRHRRPRAQAPGDRRDVHRGVRGGGGQDPAGRLPGPGDDLPRPHRVDVGEGSLAHHQDAPQRGRSSRADAAAPRGAAARPLQGRSAPPGRGAGPGPRLPPAPSLPRAGPGRAHPGRGERAERVAVLQRADAIFLEELRREGLYDEVAQAFAVLLPVRSVGVMGDARTYDNVLALRAVTTADFMTADWARLPDDFLARVSSRIVNEVAGVNRVVYDVTSKPPGTIEWE